MHALAREVEEETKTLLEAYDIKDDAARREYFAARRTAAFVRGDITRAIRFDAAASASGQPGISTELLIAVFPRTKSQHADHVTRLAVRQRLDRRSSKDRGAIIGLRRELTLASSAHRLGEIRSFADPQWRRNPEVNQEFAVALLRLWTEINLRNPKSEIMIAELTRWLKRHPDPGPNIWKARDVVLDPQSSHPVTIAIWDGIDPAVFRGRLKGGSQAGLAFDERFHPTSGLLLPVPEALRTKLPDYERYMRGIGELAAGLDTPDVTFARDWRRRLRPDDVEAFERGYSFYTNYIHGTHVAGVAVRDLPKARLISVRITFSDEALPPLLDEAAARRFARMVEAATLRMRSAGARVCNISWGFTPSDIEDNLRQHGIEPDAAARARRAKRIFDMMMGSMSAAIANSPEILFVVSAGNAGQNIDFGGDLPGSINAPNILTVGAADRDGRLASFASTGASVDLYALGTNVESVVPGGGRIRWSGASLAAPQVVNAAAKLLTVKPNLRTTDLVGILKSTTTPSEASSLPLLNPRAALSKASRSPR